MGGLELLTRPATTRANPLPALADGILVSWRFTGRAVLVLLVAYSGLFGALAGFLLNRRELALPGGAASRI